MKDPKISVIMTAYNEQEYIAGSIDSIRSQTFQDFEFLIVDDGSTDDTPKILAEYAKKDSRIKVITNEKNMGRPKSSNILLSKSRSDLIARMDADDWAHPNRLEIQYEFMEKHNDITVCGSDVSFYEVEGKTIYPKSNEQIKAAMIFYNSIAHPSSIFRKSKIMEITGGYNTNFLEALDYALWLELITYPEIKFANLPLKLIRYRVHPNKNRSTYLISQANRAETTRKALIKKIVPSVNSEELDLQLNFINFLYYTQDATLISKKDVEQLEKWFKKLIKEAAICDWISPKALKYQIGTLWQIYFFQLLGKNNYKAAARAFFSSTFWLAPLKNHVDIAKKCIRKFFCILKKQIGC